MDYTQHTAVKDKFTKEPNLCDLFKLLSIETWKRLEYAHLKPRVKIYETSLTQNIIFSINAYNDQYKLNIEILEALDENASGNDFELIIRFPDDGVEYYTPIQAKKIYKNGRYTSMDHGKQIEDLIKYASTNEARPLYLLYNFISKPFKKGVKLTSPVELTGCSFISAQFLFDNYYKKRNSRKKDGLIFQSWKIPNFYNLNPEHAFPWHELVCQNSAIELFKSLQNKRLVFSQDNPNIEKLLTDNKELKQGFFPLNTFIEDNNWINLKNMEAPGVLYDAEYQILHEEVKFAEDEMDNENNQSIIQNLEFMPKSRIILTKSSKQ